MSDTGAGNLSKDNYSFQKVVAVLGITLMTIKFIAWYVTSSVSILTDALESIVNVVAAFVGLYALYLSSKPRDLDHPYGHGKVELISSSVEGVMILVAGLMIITQAISRLIDPEPVGSLDVGLILVAIAAVANYSVGRIAIAKGKKNRSMALVASGKHLCSDTYSSVGIIVGLCLMIAFDAMGFDFWWLDPVIAMLFGLIILVTGMKVVRDSVDGVMDRMDEQTVSDVIDIINGRRHEHWVDVHNLRVIKYGPTIHIELHMIFPRNMTVEEQYGEISELKAEVTKAYGDYVDLIVMGEPCRDRHCEHCCASGCSDRDKEFNGMIEWDMDTVTDLTSDHSQSHIVNGNNKNN